NIPNDGWYAQNATGDVPELRAEFCVVAINADGHSNYNIYLYGGRGPDNVFYDDVYVLSVPSFIWTKVYGPGMSPRYGHTCHVVGRQMITVGGGSPWFASDPQSYCDWEEKGIAVLDMSSIIWGSVYSVNAIDYTVPEAVSAKVGGFGSHIAFSTNGSEPLTQPPDGFNDPYLAQLFNAGRNNGTTNSNVMSIASHGLAKGAIAEIVVGSIASTGLSFSLALLLWKRKSKRSKRALKSHEPERISIPTDIDTNRPLVSQIEIARK
ncbi:MAG: hypothetical protein FE78DRAFT_66874, partial [Acidomyces sp. 'richmondensis']